MLSDRVKINKIKGKQNKKKWKKNIDVSGLFDYIEQQNNEQRKKQLQSIPTVEDPIHPPKTELDPNRFKNKPKSQPKKKYDNSYKRISLTENDLGDPWNQSNQPKQRNTPKENIPSVIKPLSGHSYNPHSEHIEEIIEQVIDYEKPKPKKQKKIKKISDKKIVPRARNKKIRQEFLKARQLRLQRMQQHQIDSYKKLNKEIDEKNKMIEEKIQQKERQKEKRRQQNEAGRVREGKKIGKKRYKYQEYIPEEQEMGKRMSQVSTHNQFIKDRYDSIFRRGIMEPRTVKVHTNKKKNLKVKEYVQD